MGNSAYPVDGEKIQRMVWEKGEELTSKCRHQGHGLGGIEMVAQESSTITEVYIV